MHKLYNVCVNCWHKEQYCKCDKKRIEPIDYNMISILSILNKKGYKTKWCCGGHAEKSFIYIYINFQGDYNFLMLPEGFIFKKRVLYYRNKKLKTKIEKQKEINIKIKILKKWVQEIEKNI